MRLRLLAFAALLLLPLIGGCAHFVRLELPDEFKKKKLKEDPPITQMIPQPAGRRIGDPDTVKRA